MNTVRHDQREPSAVPDNQNTEKQCAPDQQHEGGNFESAAIDINRNIAETKKFEKPKVITITPKHDIVKVNGIDVEIVGEETRYLDEDGNLIKMNIDTCIKNNIKDNYATYEDFKTAWFNADDKDALASELLFSEKYILKIRNEFAFNIDKFDIISYAGWNINPISKEERINNEGVQNFVNSFDNDLSNILKILLECYKKTDFNDLKNIKIFDLPIFMQNGYTKKQIVTYFNGVDNYLRVMNELEKHLYREV